MTVTGVRACRRMRYGRPAGEVGCAADMPAAKARTAAAEMRRPATSDMRRAASKMRRSAAAADVGRSAASGAHGVGHSATTAGMRGSASAGMTTSTTTSSGWSRVDCPRQRGGQGNNGGDDHDFGHGTLRRPRASSKSKFNLKFSLVSPKFAAAAALAKFGFKGHARSMILLWFWFRNSRAARGRTDENV
jgi:hypothetical protein